MKKISTIAYLFAAAVVMTGAVSCGSNDASAQAETVAAQTSSALEVDDLLANAESLAGQAVTLEGICTHICARGGGKLFMMGSDDTKTIRVEAGSAIGKFPQDVVNNIVTVKGKLVEQRIDEAYLVRWEEQVRAQGGEVHGENAAGCDSEQKARGESGAANTVADRIAEYRTRIADRKEKEGKEYLSFYYVDGDEYTIN